MSLYNQVRPTSFDTIIGDFSHIQKHLATPNHNRFFLFSGPSGTGKTTLSKIVATTVTNNTPMDIREYNVSDKTGVDDIRNIINETFMCPMGSKICIILNEAHRLSTASQDALSDPLEFIPPHVYWIFTTTNPDKLIKAVHTRATHIKFLPLSEDNLYNLLVRENDKLELGVKKSELMMIASKSEGSARQALTYLETISTMDSGRMEYLEGAGNEDAELIELSRSAYKREWGNVVQLVDKLKLTYEAETLRRSVMGYYMAILKKGAVVNPDLVKRIHYLSEPVYDTGYDGVLLAIAKGC